MGNDDDGTADGNEVGLDDGDADGATVGNDDDGTADGNVVGHDDGDADGATVGNDDDDDGTADGTVGNDDFIIDSHTKRYIIIALGSIIQKKRNTNILSC